MAKSKTIVVWGDQDLLGSSIEYFLSGKGWRVFCISTKEELEALIQAAETETVDILIIHSGRHDDFANHPLLLLRDHPSIRVISVSLEDNMVEVYSKQKVVVKQAADLMTVIEDVSPSADIATDPGS